MNTCTTCKNLAAGWCVNAIRAGLSSTRSRQEVGPQLAELQQRCFGYVAREVKQ